MQDDSGRPDELHKLASRYLSGERRDHTLQTTALVNEACLKLAGQRGDWQSRAPSSASPRRSLPLDVTDPPSAPPPVVAVDALTAPQKPLPQMKRPIVYRWIARERRQYEGDSRVNPHACGARSGALRGCRHARSSPDRQPRPWPGRPRGAGSGRRADDCAPWRVRRTLPATPARRPGSRGCLSLPRHPAPAGGGRGSSSTAGHGPGSGAALRSPRPAPRGSGRWSLDRQTSGSA